MFNRVSTVAVYVRDQDAAKAFYTEKLGFELRGDAPFAPDNRWLTVAPPGSTTEVVLLKLDKESEHYAATLGKSQSLTFDVSDMDTLLETLKSRGVQVAYGPDVQPWGTMVVILDQDSNGLVLVETPKG
jgi:catechol 2,3-dioxygenase-like lactoylglutathione lyase family enzyme